MFSGLVEATARVEWVRRDGEGMDLAIDARAILDDLTIGDSVSLSGCCTTVTRITGQRAEFHLTRESLQRTWLGRLEGGRMLNIERALRADARLGGHFVQGHVDGVGEVLRVERRRDGTDLHVRVPEELARYCVEKGSIALDGISLTIAKLDGSQITIALIPHTEDVTTMANARAGDPLHIEVDVLAKYVERLLEGRQA